MAPTDLALSVVNGTLASIVVAGLVLRGRVKACAFFPAYLAVGVIARVLLWIWPVELYTWRYWLITELLQSALGFGAAIECGRRAFQALPAGRARTLRIQLAIAATAGLLLLWIPLTPAADSRQIAELLGRLAHARAWVFAGSLAVAYYHGVPLDRIHRDIAGGFVVWSLVMACNAQLGPLDGYLQVTRQTVASLVYPGVLLAWAAAAWARDERTAFSRELLLQLRPWRA